MTDKTRSKEEEEEEKGVPLTLIEVLQLLEQGVDDGRRRRHPSKNKDEPSMVPFSKKHPQMPRFHKMESMRTGGEVGIRGLRLCAGKQYTGPKCPVCGAINDLKGCSGCRKVFYCSRECQVHHWKNRGHKVECKKV
jgi:hypothetical protein